MSASRVLVLREIALAMAVAAAALLAVDALAVVSPGLAGLGSAVAFGGLPLVLVRWGRQRGLPELADPLGMDHAPIGRGLLLGVAASALILPVFAIGLDLVQVRILRHSRLDWTAVQSAGVAFQGRAPDLRGKVALLDDRRGLAVENHTAQPVRAVPACTADPECAPRQLAAGGRLLLAPQAADAVALTAADGAALPSAVLVAGGTGEPVASPVHARAGYGWLLAWLLSQWLVVALPEEMFFRGYVLGRLRQAFPPRRRLFGVAFGGAHVASALLFALIHLVLIPSPARLAVFFPGLVFAWLAERSRGVFAPATHHALANVCQSALLLLYAPR